MSRILIMMVVLCGMLMVGSGAVADEQPAAPDGLHVYLLIGQSNMAGRAQVTEDLAGVIDRCYLLDDKNQWVPAKNPLNLYSTIRKGAGMQKLGPGYGFAVRMLQEDPELKLGLVVNAKGGSNIKQWLGKPFFYASARKRVQAAMQHGGEFKGVLWHQGESNSSQPDVYLGQLKTLIQNLRKDFDDADLPFVAGQIINDPPMQINEVIASLPEHVPATGVASSEGLKTYDRWHFDTKSQLALGKRYAEQMIKLHAAREAENPRDKD